jgi:hypothetical protein
MEDTNRYALQLRFVGKSSDGAHQNSELDVLALPVKMGNTLHGRFRNWEPVFEDICLLMNSSAFNRKAVQRTLTAGLPADLIDRQTGQQYMFSAGALASLKLLPTTSSRSCEDSKRDNDFLTFRPH